MNVFISALFKSDAGPDTDNSAGTDELRNEYYIDFTPSESVDEINGYRPGYYIKMGPSFMVDNDGIKMIKGIELPMACASLCRTSIDVQRMAVKAAIEGDINLLKLAVLQDPLVSAVCSPDEVWAMVDEMLVAQSKWLPQYQNEMDQALERIKKSTVKKKNFKGAARMKTRSPEELKNDKESSLLVEAQAFEFDK